ncbi:uncharacterized protein MELLADRAFT_76144 [Melampsora larici-populina 98AG31]|uniref:Uncharacterized protein n=1 Tax=Melampsora larici-populina (strain 98AG31 / pathotype 3-4-7) TaxID=747676 RepID=F4SBM0_MELLP|nr:uncharacterized protein MELLADRAFT_76144 [Melampsora larici-populina 98AG31]EGF97962.1 hypothetical protein MELLADRAFT_76144 [Melampsora larici-populina 98AG31]
MTTTIQNLAPIVPFIEPTEPLQLDAIFSPIYETQQTNRISQDRKGKSVSNPGSTGTQSQSRSSNVEHTRSPSEEEIILEKTRRELEDKISELNKLKNQLAETEHRARELESKIPAS